MFVNSSEIILQVTRLDAYLWFLGFIVIINIFASFITYIDKQLAINGKHRISERTLFIVAFLGGALCEYLTMNAVSHKTKHKKFMLGLPVIFAFQFVFIIWGTFWWF